VAEHRLTAYCEHGSDRTTFDGEIPMADGIDAAVDQMQLVPLEPVPDCTPTEACLEELPPSDDAVLTVGEREDQAIDATALRLGPYHGSSCRLVRHAGMLAGEVSQLALDLSRFRPRRPHRAKPQPSASRAADAR
jgi:hypothetical protein